MDSFASADSETASESDGSNSPDAGAKRDATVPAAVSRLALPARPAQSAFEALHSSGVGDIWVPPLTSRGRPSPTQPSQAGVVSSSLRDSDDDDKSDAGSNISDDEPDGEVAMLVQHPSCEILESFDTDDLWESRIFWLLPLVPVKGAPSDSVYVQFSHHSMLFFHFCFIHFRHRFMWFGSETEQHDFEPSALDEWAAQARAIAVKSLPQLAFQKQVVCVKQGDEENWFWNFFVNG